MSSLLKVTYNSKNLSLHGSKVSTIGYFSCLVVVVVVIVVVVVDVVCVVLLGFGTFVFGFLVVIMVVVNVVCVVCLGFVTFFVGFFVVEVDFDVELGLCVFFVFSVVRFVVFLPLDGFFFGDVVVLSKKLL
uniref:ABC transmembrane type-1 domain-containing protein n=1 Tax=Strongyloides venezuelensis TaxID=75913 RepID=A0A0K0F024_STRVS